MTTSYSIFHTDGLALHFVDQEQAAAWAVAQPVNSKIARLFLAFQERPFEDGSIITDAADMTLRVFGGWTFIARFKSDNPNTRSAMSAASVMIDPSSNGHSWKARNKRAILELTG